MAEYDVIIVGAGPSGLMAAYELTARFGKSISIGIFDKGNSIDNRVCLYGNGVNDYCHSCKPCGVAEGIMGAGLKSDGKVHFHPEVMELFRMGLISRVETLDYLRYIETRFEEWGLEGPVYPIQENDAIELSKKVEEQELGDDFRLLVKKRTRHIGTDKLPSFVGKMLQQITELGNVEFHTRAEMCGYNVVEGQIAGIEVYRAGRKKEYSAKKFLMGLGRKGSLQLFDLIRALDVAYTYRPAEIGGRIEVPYDVMRKVTDSLYNPCFRQFRNGRATYTFCTNPRGFLTTELLFPSLMGVNGESRLSRHSAFTNFAILTEVPVLCGTNPNDYIINLLQNGFRSNRPITQTVNDFMHGTILDEQKCPEGTLSGKKYGDLSSLFPAEITEQFRTFLQRLDKICPGIISSDALFVAPEAKIRGVRVSPVNLSLESSIKDLHLIGDSSGLSGNIVAAALTGLIVARNINID